MPGPNEIDPPQPTPFEALVRRLAEEANTPDTISTDDLLNLGRFSCYYLERFARLVAEECAKEADDAYRFWDTARRTHDPDSYGHERCAARADCGQILAQQIRDKFRNA